jgi:RNA polymerase sigma factor (sigma-70 family)
MKSLSDSELIARYASTNDEAAFRELYDRHSSDVMNFLINQVQVDDARDLLQEVFICVIRLHHTYLPGSNVGAWLISIARSRIVTFMRHANRMRRKPKEKVMTLSAENNDSDSDLDVADKAWNPDLLLQLRELVERLPAEERGPVELVYFQRMKYIDAAAQLGIADGTLKSRISRAIKRLRTWMSASTMRDVA